MKMKLILCSLVALLSFGTKASAAPDPNFYIYLCFGQSNMVRCAVINGGGATDFCARFLDSDERPLKRITLGVGDPAN